MGGGPFGEAGSDVSEAHVRWGRPARSKEAPTEMGGCAVNDSRKAEGLAWPGVDTEHGWLLSRFDGAERKQ